MIVFDRTLLEIVLRSSIIYAVVLVGIRLTGKREVGQMTPFDLVLLLLIANAVQNAMTGPDTSVTGGVVAAATLLLINVGLSSIARRWNKVRRVEEGSPTLLIHRGKVIEKNLTHERMNVRELRQALREHGVATIEEVQQAVLEVDGSVSVLKNDEMPSVSQPHHRIRFLNRKPS
jgi:uncharacterized membrane protein YcaP (DUF421 family)